MREDPIDLDDSAVDEGPLRELPFTRPEAHATAFTAVNGDFQRGTPFGAPVVGKSLGSNNNGSTNDTIVVTTQFNSHAWRPNTDTTSEKPSESLQRDLSESNKRKRSTSPDDADDDVQAGEAHGDGRESPKRRQLSALVDSAVDLTSPDKDSQPAPFAQTDILSEHGPTTSRERTPVPRWSQMDQPPKPRPETEASLAQSVLKFQQNQQATESRQSQPAATEKPSSPQDDLEQDEAEAQEDDQMQGDNFDPKKRKRNFSNRTKTGCHTCRGRKKKCDERKPICSNCERGGFVCGGYGPKPAPGFKAQGQSRAVVPLQSKAPYEPPPGPTGYWPPHPNDSRQFDPWARMPPEQEPPRPLPEPANIDPRLTSNRDNWPRPSWPPPDPRPPAYLPPADFLNIPRPQSFAPDHQPLMPLPPPLPLDPWALNPGFPPYRHQTGPPTMFSSRDSVISSGSHRTGQFGSNQKKNEYDEKEKMLRGQSYLHFIDHILIGERTACHNALVRFNKSADKPQEFSQADRARLFTQILEPTLRPNADKSRRDGPIAPIGSVKEHTIVEAPFKCDYGYHIHLGKDTVIQPGCYFQDAGGIFVGDRVIVGTDSQLLTMTAANDCSQRKGSQGHFKAGTIRIEDDVYIGSNVLVLPYVTIGKGSVVGAGSVVTRDVEEQTIVAGNPAKKIRRIEGRNSEQHLSSVIQDQELRTVEWMQQFAASGFNSISPRII